VPFAVDVHATQWGTLTRLVHAVGAGLVDEGWAIDEGTVLVVDDGSTRVEGLGSAYRVAPRDGAVAVSVQP
jgi:cyanophycinase